MKPIAPIVIIQTHVPEYRVPFFRELERTTGKRVEVWGSDTYFTETMQSGARAEPWYSGLKNHFFFGRTALWQSGHLSIACRSKLCVLELNPRVLSSWLILVFRRLRGKHSAVWGHLHPRAGGHSRTRFLRFAMIRLAGNFVAYTHSAAAAAMELSGRVRVFEAPNGILWSRECGATARPEAGRFRILFVGRLIAAKKPMLLLEGFALALSRLPEAIHLDFIGDGPLKAELERRVRELGLGERVSVHGALFRTDLLRPFYAEALASVSPGYLGLSAIQSFGWGVPMLVSEKELHSVEIEACRIGFNCDSFPSDSPLCLGEALARFVLRPPVWSQAREEIARAARADYTYDTMVAGFLKMFQERMRVSWEPRPLHVAIAWRGLPYYGARCIREAQLRHPEWRFTIISSRDSIPYKGIDEMVGGKVHWVDLNRPVTWASLAVPYPDLMLSTSWPHAAYQALARDAKSNGDGKVVCMVDNYLRYTPKQFLGWLYFRQILRPLFDSAWVPGAYGRRFLRFLGMADEDIHEGLYSADPDLFRPPIAAVAIRRGIVFVGQLIRRKGVVELAAAVRQLRHREALTADVTFIGQGPLRDALIKDGMDVRPFQQPVELVRSYQQASAMILPSRVDHWGLVAHEAALCGCLLLVTRQCGCVAELVEHRVNGYVMESSSVKEIIAAITWLNQLSERERTIGRAVSLQRALKISPRLWADTLDILVNRFVVLR